MGKTFLSSFILVVAILLAACSSNPFVGEWAPDNDTSGNGVIRINSNGTAKSYGVTDEGTYSIQGKWSNVEGKDNAIQVTYDASTIEVNLDNPFAAEIVRTALKEMASKTLTLTISDDGEKLYGGGNGYFVRY